MKPEFERSGDNFICACCGEPIRYTMAGDPTMHEYARADMTIAALRNVGCVRHFGGTT